MEDITRTASEVLGFAFAFAFGADVLACRRRWPQVVGERKSVGRAGHDAAEESSPPTESANEGAAQGLHRIGAYAPVREVAPALILEET